MEIRQPYQRLADSSRGTKDAATDACIIFNIKRKQRSPHAVEKLVRQTAEADGYETEVVLEEEPGSSGKALSGHYIRNILPDFRVRLVPTSKSKMVRGHYHSSAIGKK